jgi:two-component system nitrate/nitrite response regulator NarL
MDALHTRVRVLVVDSSRIHTQLLSDILERDPNFEVIAWDSHRSTIVSTALTSDVDVLVVSSSLNGSLQGGVPVIREMRAAKPGTKVVVLLHSYQDQLVLDCIRSGARGIFSHESSLDMLRKCLYSVNRGEIWLDNRGMSLVVNALASAPSAPVIDAKALENLSERECQAMEWLLRGLSNKEISDRMGLSQHTVKNYIFRIFGKMGVSSRAELLFLILSQQHAERAEIANKVLKNGQPDHGALTALIEESEKGSSTAQLALAQAYSMLGDDSKNIANAYKWYVIVAERVAQAQSVLAKSMTSKELEEIQREARYWLAQMKHVQAEKVNVHARSGKGSLLAS